jgi:hypothetical protein
MKKIRNSGNQDGGMNIILLRNGFMGIQTIIDSRKRTENVKERTNNTANTDSQASILPTAGSSESYAQGQC